MLKRLLSFGTVLIVILMVSTVTAVPQVNSNPLMNKIYEIEENRKIMDEKLFDSNLDFENRGLIDLIIQIIQWLISIIENMISLVGEIFGIVELIENLINLIETLFELISALIDSFFDIFNPDRLIF